MMGKPLPMELRQLVVDFVEEGHSHRTTASQFRVSVRSVNDMVLMKRATGALDVTPQGNGGRVGRLAAVAGWIEHRIRENRDPALDEVAVGLRCKHGVEARRASIWRRLRGLDVTRKKRLAGG